MYDSDGKQAFRELLLALAQSHGVTTFGTFWGSGIDARMFSAAGLDVVAAEIVQAKRYRLQYDALQHGYRPHFGRAGKITERREMFHADFDGGPSPRNFREVRRIAAITDRWLAVTLSLDHMRDESMQGEAAAYTIPAWLTGASGFTLEYLGRYQRNRLGQMMWTAILQRKAGRGTNHQVLPVQITYSLGERGYWASRELYRTTLLPHHYSPRNAREKAADNARYEARKIGRAARSVSCGVCQTVFVIPPTTRGRPSSVCSARCRRASRRAYHHLWYLDQKAAVSGTAAEAILLDEAA